MALLLLFIFFWNRHCYLFELLLLLIGLVCCKNMNQGLPDVWNGYRIGHDDWIVEYWTLSERLCSQGETQSANDRVTSSSNT